MDKHFPKDINLYNIGIKDRKLQEQTLASVQYLEAMN